MNRSDRRSDKTRRLMSTQLRITDGAITSFYYLKGWPGSSGPVFGKCHLSTVVPCSSRGVNA